MSDAAANFERHLVKNAYPGRGLVLGRSEDDTAFVQIYWIMGRSEGSRNRVFVADGTTLCTAPWDDGAGIGDASLTLYEAMLEVSGVHLVTNGDQTRTIADAIPQGGDFESALATREREHDAPNFTPRISGMHDLRAGAPAFALSILRANPRNPELTDRVTWRPAALAPGTGLGLTTYRGDGSPLPPFVGDPLVLPVEGMPDEVLEAYWSALDRENRVALAVKWIPDAQPARIAVRNRHHR